MMGYFNSFATVADVLRYKQSADPERGGILHVPTSSTFEQLLAFLADHHIGVAFLTDEDNKSVIGIISERDVIRHLMLHGPTAFHLPIFEFASRPVKCCKQSDRLREIAARMSSENIRHMAVKNDNSDYIGVISASDIEFFSGEG